MKLLRRELTKLVHQKRSYVGWGGLLAVPLLITGRDEERLPLGEQGALPGGRPVGHGHTAAVTAQQHTERLGLAGKVSGMRSVYSSPRHASSGARFFTLADHQRG